jgi:hypothetical protein
MTSMYRFGKSGSFVDCRLCTRRIRNNAAAKAAHGKMHVRQGRAVEKRVGAGVLDPGHLMYVLKEKKK